jgi:hypothetical protein
MCYYSIACRFIREVLDRSGGSFVKIIAKIENEAGLENYDDILSVTNGIMVARGDLAMEVGRVVNQSNVDRALFIDCVSQLLGWRNPQLISAASSAWIGRSWCKAQFVPLGVTDGMVARGN